MAFINCRSNGGCIHFYPTTFFHTKAALPYAFYLIKNKSVEAEGKVKLRLIYSYAAHPLKRFSKLVASVLSIFLKENKTGLHSICIPWKKLSHGFEMYKLM